MKEQGGTTAGTGVNWDAVARGWEKWRETMESGTFAVTDRLIEMAAVRPGWRVLDLACGVGQPALTAAQRVAPGGEVLAVDQAQVMLDLARRQAESLGLANVRFVRGDAGAASAIPEVRGPFDAVLCRWGLMFLADLPAALKDIHGLLEPGRGFAAAVWSVPERVPSISLPFEVASAHLRTPPMCARSPGPFRLADGDALRLAFEEAGFSQVFVEFMPVASEAPSAEAYVAMSQDLNAPLAELLKGRSTEETADFWDALRGAAGRYGLPDGRVRFWNEAICITGMRQ